MLPKIPMSQGRSVDLLADGKIQLAGREYTFAQTWPAVVVRLNPNGTLDGTFGTQGVQELPSLPFGGGFFTASYLTSKQEYYCASLGSFGPVLARIRVDGTLDATQ